MTFSRGIASLVEAATDLILGKEGGSIDAVAERLDARVGAQNDRIERMEGRLERRREMLIRRFSALEEAMARAQTQMQWLTAQLASLPQVGGGGSIL
jgi:flagellar hook-associated protein 2